jgi:Fic family protein
VGDYKEYPNSVRLENGEIFHYASPIDTPIKMQELIDWYRSEEGSIHPVTLAAMLHYKFVSIHPFDDGNGRISRLLVNYVLIRNGLPPVVIKSSDKANYLRALHLADVGDVDLFMSDGDRQT